MATKVAISAVVAGLLLTAVKAEKRWCRPSAGDRKLAPDLWLEYDDASHACVRCSEKSITLLSIKERDNMECCSGSLVARGSCGQTLGSGIFGRSLGPTASCSASVQCDAIKQCPDGRDEVGCRECAGTDLFSCTEHPDSTPCIASTKVCDKMKDCAMGLDETGCVWYGGWCDGFLCGSPHERCIPLSQVCDGEKQCMDGSDEFNCRHCLKQFRCVVFQRLEPDPDAGSNTTTAECVGRFRICDGVSDCTNGLDETGCYRWREWAAWSACDDPPSQCNRARRRVCINKAGAEVEPSKCYNVEDYLNPGFFGTDSETGLCPACSTSAAASSAYVTFASSLTPSTTAVMQETTEEAFLTSAVDETSLNSTFARLMATARDVTTADVVLTEALATSRSTAATSKAMETTPSLSTTLAPFANGTAEAVLSTGESVRTPSVTVAATTSLTSPLPTFPVTRSSDIKTSTVIAESRHVASTSHVTSHVTYSTTSTPRQPALSVVSMSVIIAVSVAAALILLAIICAIFCCCSERKRKRGKWTPRRWYREPRTVAVPQMYLDVSLEDVRPPDVVTKQHIDPEAFANTPTLNTFLGTVSGVDSGIDESNSTTSSVHRPIRNGSAGDSVNGRNGVRGRSSRDRSKNRSALVRTDSDLPPPPPNL